MQQVHANAAKTQKIYYNICLPTSLPISTSHRFSSTFKRRLHGNALWVDIWCQLLPICNYCIAWSRRLTGHTRQRQGQHNNVKEAQALRLDHLNQSWANTKIRSARVSGYLCGFARFGALMPQIFLVSVTVQQFHVQSLGLRPNWTSLSATHENASGVMSRDCCSSGPVVQTHFFCNTHGY